MAAKKSLKRLVSKAKPKAKAKAPARAKAKLLKRKVDPIPKGVHTLVPHLSLSNCAAALEFYKKAFGAKELSRMNAPDGSGIWHAELKIGDSVLYLNDAMPGMGSGPSNSAMYIWTKNADGLFDQAVAAGATVVYPMMDAFWGDRSGTVKDPFGQQWSFMVHVKDMTNKQIEEAGRQWAAQQAQQQPPPSSSTPTTGGASF